MPVGAHHLLPDFFRNLVQSLPDLVWIKDPEGVYLACNPRFESLYGVPESQIVGRTDTDFVSADMAAFFRQHDLAAIAAGRTLQNEESLTFASDGHVEHVQTLKTPMHEAQGRLIGVLGIARDLSEQVRLRTDLQRSLQRLHEAERMALLGSWEQIPALDLLIWSDQVHHLFGTDPATHRPSLGDFFRRVHPEDRDRVQALYMEARRTRQPFHAEHRIVHSDGSIRHVVESAELYFGEGDSDVPVRVVGMVQDVTTRVEQQRDIDERRLLFEAVVSQSAEAIAVIDPLTGRFVQFNDAAPALLGHAREAFAQLTVADIEADHTPEQVADNLRRMSDGQVGRFESRHRHRDGSLRDVQISGQGIRVGGRQYVVAIWRDITEARQSERRIQQLAFNDQLTQLPNRLRLAERVTEWLLGTPLNQPAALLIVNVDRFHAINDALGHPVGDAVLREVARRLGALDPAADAVMHLGGDEFVLLQAAQADRSPADASAEALRLAHAAVQALQQPMQAAEHAMQLRISVGISLLPAGEADSFSEVMRRADTALHRAKRATVHRVAFFDETMGEAVRHRFELEQALREAIPGGQLRLFLQPQVDVHGRLVAAEALVRWQHPERGLVPPGDFIPVAEDSGLIVALDRWMVEAVAQLSHQLRQRRHPLRIAVNISPKHFHSPEFVSWVQASLTQHGALPEDLVIEVTEGLVIENVDEVINKMHELSATGVGFSVDDFGTGYSSLAYLKRLPIDELKIDRSFVKDAADDPDSVAIISTILAVAHHMDLAVVAEGIETPQQASLLAGLAPKIRLQGYHFGRPLPVDEWVARWVPSARDPS